MDAHELWIRLFLAILAFCKGEEPTVPKPHPQPPKPPMTQEEADLL